MTGALAATGIECDSSLRCARARYHGWIGALLLCVMLAAAGMPKGGAGLVAATGVELGLGHGQRGPRCHRPAICSTEPAALTKGSVLATALTMLPRGVPRALSILDGGLPPSRAPTV